MSYENFSILRRHELRTVRKSKREFKKELGFVRENHLLLRYLSENEKEAKLWFIGKRFTPTFLRKNVSYASDSLYQEMSEFIHSSFKSTFNFIETEKVRTKATLGEYSNEQFKDVLFLMLMTMATTIIWLS